MESKLNPGRHHAEDTAWSISADTRQGAQEADACLVFDGWLYAAPAPVPPRARPEPTGADAAGHAPSY